MEVSGLHAASQIVGLREHACDVTDLLLGEQLANTLSNKTLQDGHNMQSATFGGITALLLIGLEGEGIFSEMLRGGKYCT